MRKGVADERVDACHLLVILGCVLRQVNEEVCEEVCLEVLGTTHFTGEELQVKFSGDFAK